MNRERFLTSPVGLIWRLLSPGRCGVRGEAHVIVGAGGGLVGEVWGQQGGAVVFNDHRVVLRHVDGGRQLVVT